MKRLVNLVIVLAILGVFIPLLTPQPVSAMTGSGTEGDPYIIYDIYDFNATRSNATAFYILANDIDASITSTWDGGSGWLKIYDDFYGTIDGKGHTISNLYSNRPAESCTAIFYDLYGIFKNINFVGLNFTSKRVSLVDSNYGLIEHILVEDSNYASTSSYASGIADGNFGTITHCTINGCSINGTADASGICDSNFDEICYCWVTNSVIWSVKYASGICDSNDRDVDGYGIIVRCGVDSTTITSTTRDASGICDTNNIADNFIEECIVRDDVVIMGRSSSGICCSNYGEILNCYSRADLILGGLNENSGISEITDYLGASITNCYFAGTMVGTPKYGICAYPLGDGVVSDCFWDQETSGTVTSYGGTNESTLQMKIQGTFTNWDFDDVWGIDSTFNDGYPFLLWEYSIWTLYASSTLGGDVSAPGEGSFSYYNGEVVDLVATAESGYSFYRWTGSGTASVGNKYSGTTNITMNGTYSIMANFQSGDLLPFPVIPIITPEEEEADPSILPWYDLIHPAAVGLGWRTIDFWSILIIFIAIAMGVGVMIATGSVLLAAITVAIVLFVGVSMSILSLWVVIVYAIFSGSYLIAVRAM